MASDYYTAEEAAAKLGKTPEVLTQLAKEGKLREFRDAGKISYRVEEVDALSGDAGASGEVVLQPAEDSGFEIALAGSDVLSIDEVDAAGTQAGAKKDKKGGTVVPSVGVSVFDDDELDEVVDPLAQTQVTDAADLGIGSGSGILDLTRESDETSLGAELLDEIGPGGEDETLEMGEETRAGLEEAITDDPSTEEDVLQPVGPAPISAGQAIGVQRMVYGPDAASSALTALMVVATMVLMVGALGAAAMVRGVWPAPLDMIYQNMAACFGGAAGVAAVASIVTYLLAKR